MGAPNLPRSSSNAEFYAASLRTHNSVPILLLVYFVHQAVPLMLLSPNPLQAKLSTARTHACAHTDTHTHWSAGLHDGHSRRGAPARSIGVCLSVCMFAADRLESKGVTLWKPNIKEFLFSRSSKGGHDQRGRRADRRSDSLAGWGEEEEEEEKHKVISVYGPLFTSPPTSPLLLTACSSVSQFNEFINFSACNMFTNLIICVVVFVDSPINF